MLSVGADARASARTRRRYGGGPPAGGDEPTRSAVDGLAGTPGEVVDKIGRFAELGASRVYLQVLDLADLDHLGLVAAEVAPHV